jgi:hypothetical protein
MKKNNILVVGIIVIVALITGLVIYVVNWHKTTIKPVDKEEIREYEKTLETMPLADYISSLGNQYLVAREGIIDDLTRDLTAFFLGELTRWLADGYPGYSIAVLGQDFEGGYVTVKNNDSGAEPKN